MQNSYVYQHVNIESKEIFYIGIGSSKKYERAFSINNRNRIWHNYIKKHGLYSIEILKDCISRADACIIETNLIKEYGRIIDGSGRLVNISFGGEKTFYGMVRTKEHCKKISESQKGKIVSKETKEKQRIAKLGTKHTKEQNKKISKSNKGKIRTIEQRINISNGQKGNTNAMGRIVSDKHKKTLSLIHKKPVICLNNNKRYDSMQDAAEQLNFTSNHISSVCKGKRPHTFGYKFQYA
jgi:hypothetical protein